jgi:hypothetical protein
MPTVRSRRVIDDAGAINEYTDTDHGHAGVPHALIVAPGLVIERSTSATGSGAAHPTTSCGPT